MKKVFLLIVLIVVIQINATEPQSMRSIATDGIFDGVWDHLFDTLELYEIDSTYIFTNFSDYHIQSDYSDFSINAEMKTEFMEELPIGIAFSNPFSNKMKHTLYFRFRDTLLPENSSNESESYITEYSDITGDDIYDYKLVTHDKSYDNGENSSVFDWIWNTSWHTKDYSYGFKFSSFSTKRNYDNTKNILGLDHFDPWGEIDTIYYGTETFSHAIDYYDLENDELTYQTEEDGDFSTTLNSINTNIAVSLGKKEFLEKTSLRFDLSYNKKDDQTRKTEDRYNAAYKEIIIADTLTNEGTLNDVYLNDVTKSEDKIYISSTLKKKTGEFFAGDEGYWELGLSTGILSGKIEDQYSRHIMYNKFDDASEEDFTITRTSDHTSRSGEKGDFCGFDLGLSYKMNLPLNDNAAFGIGGFYNYCYQTGTNDYVAEMNYIDTYQTGLEMDDSNDFTVTNTEYLTADVESIGYRSSLRIPVALEFKIPKNHLTALDGFSLRNFVFRLGTSYTLNSEETERTYKITDSNPNFQITEYGDGSISVMYPGSLLLQDTKTINKLIESGKQFSFGIGYRHSDNVNIDLASYYDHNTEDYYLGLSFTISK